MKTFLTYLLLISSLNLFAQTSDCDNTPAGQITPSTSCVTQPMNSNNNTDYWNSAGANGACSETDVDDVWMWFTATNTTTTVTYDAVTNNPIVTIFQGACSPTMNTNIDCANNNGNGGIETVTFTTTIGTTYHIRVQATGTNNSMDGEVCVQSGTIPTTTSSECAQATNVCTNLNFLIDANGFGTTEEITWVETVSNPWTNPTSSNAGCLLAGENNSTWMIVNIATAGILEFTFGGGGTQVGYYDWVMYPYSATTCASVIAGTLAPVRCNWNGFDFGGTGLQNTIPLGGDVQNFESGLNVTAGSQYLICFSNYSGATTSVPLIFGSGAGNAGVTCTPLPIELISFDVKVSSTNTVDLTWETASERDNDFFTIDKSTDGINWAYIGDIDGAGTSPIPQFYYLEDLHPNLGTNYYRLKQTDFNGAYSYLDIRAINIKNQNQYMLYPNPTSKSVNIYGLSKTDEIKIINCIGQLIDFEIQEISKDKIEIYTENFTNGIYQVIISGDFGVCTLKLSVLN